MAKKSLGGRPTKLNKDVVKKLEEAFSIDATVEEACFYADISRETFYNWMKADKKLFDRLEALRARPVLTARQTVIRAIKDNPDIAMKYLERKKKAEFSPRQEITGADGHSLPPIQVEIVRPKNANTDTQKHTGDNSIREEPGQHKENKGE